MLSASPSAREPSVLEIGLAQLERPALVVRKDRDGDRAGVDAAAALGDGYALDPVSSGLVPEADDVPGPDLGEAGRQRRLVWSADGIEVADVGCG